MLPTVVAAIHLLSLVAGVSALILRGKALAAAEDEKGLDRVFLWDNVSGLVAIAWIGSGLYRAFGGLEKGTEYYLGNHVFWLKMLVLVILMSIECVPMVTFIRWRVRIQKKQSIDLMRKARLVKLHWVELSLIPVMVAAATFMARGVGSVPKSAALAVPAVNAAQIAAGAAIYRTQCSTCHQPDGRGYSGKLAADFVGDGTRLAKSDEVLLKSIANGVPGTAMIGFAGRLEDAQMRDVLAYIRASFGNTAAAKAVGD